MIRASNSIAKICRYTLTTNRELNIKHKSTTTTAPPGGNATTTSNTSNLDAATFSSTTTTTKAIDAAKKYAKELPTISLDKLAPRAPLVKNFFLGVVDKELLAYPEVIKREELSNLHNQIQPIERFFDEERFQLATAADKVLLTPELLEDVRRLGLFGLNAPRAYHGSGYNWSESLIASTPETNCTSLSLGLLTHRVLIDLLEEVGTAKQKEEFLGHLASGSKIGTEAVFEYNAPEDGFFHTKADFCPETKKWSISGEKAFVVTMPASKEYSHLYVVIAETQRPNVTNEASRGTTIFLVDSTLPGVWPNEVHETLGCRGVPMRRVKFDRVQVPENCVIGNPNEGNKYADILLRANRLRGAMLSLGLAKSLVNELAVYCVNNKQCGVALNDMEAIKTHLSKSLCAAYAIESMIFYTAGLLDEFDKPDVLLEAAIIKYFTLKELLCLTTRTMDIIGPKTLHAGHATEKVYRDSAQLYTQGETMDSLRFFISLSGLQYAGTLMSEDVRMSRNPLFNPAHFLGKLMQNSSIDMPKTKMRLADNLHPRLEQSALSIEHSVARLRMCVDLLLIRYGNTIIERHNEMQRLADMATTIFAMFASASRASRSYCIGLQYADNEMLIATSICNHGRELVKCLATDIFQGEILNNDKNLQRLSTQFDNCCCTVWRGNAADFRFYDAFFSASYLLRTRRQKMYQAEIKNIDATDDK